VEPIKDKMSVFAGTGHRIADGATVSGKEEQKKAAAAGTGSQRKNPWKDPNFFPGKQKGAAGAAAGSAPPATAPAAPTNGAAS
jgi:hypothetical protein